MGNVIYLAGRDQPAGILLVESDPLVRIAPARHLRRAGISVVEAIDGSEALKLLRAGRTILLVFGELDRPDHGFDLIAALRRDFPKVKLLLSRARDTGPIVQNDMGTVDRFLDLGEVEEALKPLLTKASDHI